MIFVCVCVSLIVVFLYDLFSFAVVVCHTISPIFIRAVSLHIPPNPKYIQKPKIHHRNFPVY